MQLVVAGKGPAYERIVNTTECIRVPAGTPLRSGDVLLSVQYDRIVTGEQLAGFRGAFNLHFGVLPEYRGCLPIKWSIINGDPIGVTFHYMTPGVDEGPIIAQWSTPSDSLTDGQGYEWCNRAAVSIWNVYRDDILAGKFPPAAPQDESRARYYKRELPFGGLRENVPDHLLERAERAFTHPGYPGLR